MVFIEYLPGNSLFHKLDVRTKCVWLIAILILSFIFTDPLYVLIVGIAVLATAFLIGLESSRLKRIFKPLIPVLLCILIFTGFGISPDSFTTSWAKTRLFELLGAPMTIGGILMGVTYLLRLMIIVVSTSIVTLTTPLDDFIVLMRKLRLPYELAFAFSTAVRFIPTLMKESEAVMDAQRARGMRLEGGFIQQVKSRIPIMIPMIVGGIRKSENLAIAMLVRGFGATKNRTILREIKMKGLDYQVMAAIIAITLFGIFIRAMGYGVL